MAAAPANEFNTGDLWRLASRCAGSRQPEKLLFFIFLWVRKVRVSARL
jgi:hypothetical protein